MTNKEWITLIEEHEDALRDTIEEAYEKACGASPDLVYCVELDQVGRIGIAEFIGSNSMSGCVHDGNAIEIIRIAGFDPTDGDDFSYFPEDDMTLTDTEKKDFLAWAEANDTGKPTPSDLEEWDEIIYHRWYNDYCENYLSQSDGFWDALEDRKKELRQMSEWYGE